MPCSKVLTLIAGLILAAPIAASACPQSTQAEEGVPPSQAGAASHYVTSEARAVHVQWSHNLLSISATNAPLADVLREISRQTGIEIRGLEELSERVSVEARALPLDAGLAKLLSNRDYIILGDLSEHRERQPVLLWVRKHGPGGSLPSAQAIQQARAVISGEPASGAKVSEEAAGDISQQIANQSGEDFAQSDTSSQTEADDTQTGDAEASDEANPVKKLSDIGQSFRKADESALSEAVSDADPVVQASAFEALAYLDRDGAIDALQTAMESDRPATRLEALQLLENSANASEPTILAALRRAIKDNDISVRTNAIQALANRDGNEATDLLREALQDPDPAVRVIVISSVNEKHRSLLFQAMSDPDESVRSLANTLLQQAAGNER